MVRTRRKLKTKVGKAVYAARKAIVEPVSGRSNRRAGSGSSCCGASKKCGVNGHWYALHTIS